MATVVMGGALLRRHVIRIKADMTLTDVKRHGILARRKPPDVGNPQLDREVPTGCEGACCVAEARNLLSLSAQIADAVPDQIDENSPGALLVAMSPTTAGMSGILRCSWSTIG
jgi:hypothetical protein